MEDERPCSGPGLGALDLADEERVVAGGMLVRSAAAQPADRPVELRRPVHVAEGIRSQSAIGGTPRAKCCASDS